MTRRSPYLVELHRPHDARSAYRPIVERWRYETRELALCRVTQLLVAHPTADLSSEETNADVVYVLKLDV